MDSRETQCINIQKIVEHIKNASRKTCCAIEVLDDTPGTLDNKIGGVPYLPVGEPFPTDSNGNPMSLLLQIRCRDINLPEFPDEGVLEIFVSSSLTALPFECTVKLFPENLPFQILSPQPANKDDIIIVKNYPRGHKILVSHQPSYISVWDFRFEYFLADALSEVLHVSLPKNLDVSEFFPDVPDANEVLLNSFPSDCHIAIGGYPDFTQDDPRPSKKCPKNLTTCLFKLDSIYNMKLFNIGDAGILCVFISDEDLASCNFSGAVAEWDCC